MLLEPGSSHMWFSLDTWDSRGEAGLTDTEFAANPNVAAAVWVQTYSTESENASVQMLS